MLNETIDKAYCINLEHRYDRWYQAKDMFEANGLNVERFTAIDGREIKTQYPGITPGAAGCTLSHYFLIERSKLMGFKAVLILEDDVELHRAFNSLIKMSIKLVPDGWDMLMLGGSHWQKPTPINDFVSKVSHTLTSHAYILRSSLYDELLTRLATMSQPVDGIFTEIQKTRNIYVTNPPLAWQRGGWSDIEGREMNYDHLKTNNQ